MSKAKRIDLNRFLDELEDMRTKYETETSMSEEYDCEYEEGVLL